MKLINKLYESCETCFKFRNSKPKSKVGPPMALDFNHTVCMDLKIWHGKGTIILYIIDMFTRFTIAKIIPDKTADSGLKVFVNDWIKFWGSPSQILVDNGGEFINAKMMSICETFSIKFVTTGPTVLTKMVFVRRIISL